MLICGLSNAKTCLRACDLQRFDCAKCHTTCSDGNVAFKKYTKIRTSNHCRFQVNNAMVKSLHVSEQSDLWEPGTKYVGLVFWKHHGRSSGGIYRLGRIRVRPGYIIIVKSETILKQKSGQGQVYGKVFQHVTGLDTMVHESNNGLEMGGFAYDPCKKEDGDSAGFQWQSRSTHNTINRNMPEYQRNAVRNAVQQFWESSGSTQNLYLDSSCTHSPSNHKYQARQNVFEATGTIC
jgi:hypothetical protein